MISVDELADLLNREINDDFMTAIHESWEDGDSPFDPEHPVIEEVLEKIVDVINEDWIDSDYDDDDD